MKINLGCGDHYAPGWVNVDTDGSPHQADRRFDLTEPWPDDIVDITHAYLGHVLEHLVRTDAEQVLHRLADVMTPHGALLIVGPDVDRAAMMRNAGELSETEFQGVVHGRGAWRGDTHLWPCSESELVAMVHRTGRWGYVSGVPVEVISDQWPVVSRVGWQCAVSALALD